MITAIVILLILAAVIAAVTLAVYWLAGVDDERPLPRPPQYPAGGIEEDIEE